MCHNSTINYDEINRHKLTASSSAKKRTPPDVRVPATATQTAAEQHPTDLNQDNVKQHLRIRGKDTHTHMAAVNVGLQLMSKLGISQLTHFCWKLPFLAG